MTTKRDWSRELKALKKKPRALSPAECDELILLLGGTVRPNHRPKSFFRAYNWTAIADVVFCFLENAEYLAECEADLREMNSPGYLEKVFPNMAVKNRTEAERLLAESMATARPNLERLIASLRPISAKNLAEAKRMASEWFAKRGTELNFKQIENRLGVIQEAAGLKCLGLAEWREIKAKDDATPARCIARTNKEAEREKNSQALLEEMRKELAQMKNK